MGQAGRLARRYIRAGMHRLVIDMEGQGEDIETTVSSAAMGYLFDGNFRDLMDEAQRKGELSNDEVRVPVSLCKMAAKTDAEKEEEEVERLNRVNPKHKPPRQDRRRNRMKIEDPDMHGFGAEDDPDLSMNYKKRAVERVVSRWTAMSEIRRKLL